MNQELLKKAREAKTAEELLKIAHDAGLTEFTEENARGYYDLLHQTGEMADSELEDAAGGCTQYYENTGKRIVTSGNLCAKRMDNDRLWVCRSCGMIAALCNCYPEPTEFEDFWGVVIRKTKESCGTCDFLHSNPNKLYFYCSQLGNW